MEIYGKIIGRFEPRNGVSSSGKNWTIREYLLETLDEKYPRKMLFEVFGEDKVKEFNEATNTKGALVTVHFDIDAREYKGRWYNSIRAWKIEAGQKQADPLPAQQQSIVNAPAVQNVIEKTDAEVLGTTEENGELPF